MGDDDMPPERAESEEDPAIAIVRRVYGDSARSRKPRHPHELLAEEVGGITEHYVPEVDLDELRDIQMDYLRKKDDIIARGHKEEQLAKRLDDLARQTQKRIAQKIGRERYERLMGMPAGEEVGLVEPGAVGMAGVPVPPPEALVEPTEGEERDEGSSRQDDDAGSR